jgi:glycerol-3-phosphate dehydrogenase
VLHVRSGEQHEYPARALVNAAGPWVAALREQLQQSPHGSGKYSIRLVKGSHIVVPLLTSGEHAFTLQQPDGRVVFLLPFERDYSLIGTTEIEHADPDTPPVVTAGEIDYLCTAASRTLRTPVTAGTIVWSFAGLRALFDDGKSNPGAITRDYHLQLDGRSNEAPLLSVFGGKLTTYRALAETVMGRLAPWFPALGPSWTATTPLPGGERPYAEVVAELRATHPTLPADWLEQLTRRHGSRALPLLAAVHDARDLGRNFGGGLYQLEVEHFIRHEWARDADDILWRRSKAGLHMAPAERTAFTDWLTANHPGA